MGLGFPRVLCESCRTISLANLFPGRKLEGGARIGTARRIVAEIVGKLHQFHDRDYAEGWSQRFTPTPERLKLFDTIIDRLAEAVLPSRHVVELGVGPGYLAERLLARFPDITYEGVDFSEPMLELARRRLSAHAERVKLTQADLLGTDWTLKLSRPVGACVSTWALHDLGGEAQTAKIYGDCRSVLPSGGLLIDGDFVKPERTAREFEPGRFPVARHLELLTEAGFRNPRVLVVLEQELVDATPAQNYACMEGVV
jgi:SAM-dependent methyltransferase